MATSSLIGIDIQQMRDRAGHLAEVKSPRKLVEVTFEPELKIFANRIYPISIMPSWLQVISQVKPLTYETRAFRVLMLSNGHTVYEVSFDLLFLLVATAINAAITAKLYPRFVT